MIQHPSEDILALYAGDDLDFVERIRVALHVRGCGACRRHVANHRAILADLVSLRKGPVDELNWDRLSEEMSANIRLGISMAECVGPAPVEKRNAVFGDWKPVMFAAGALVLLSGAFLLNMPLDRIARVWSLKDQTGLVLESTASGIEMRRDGRPLITVRHPDRKASQDVSANLDGSMRQGFVDDETGQVTIINVASQ